MLLSLFVRRATVCFCWGLFLVFLPSFLARPIIINLRNGIRDCWFVAGRSVLPTCGDAGGALWFGRTIYRWQRLGRERHALSGGTLSVRQFLPVNVQEQMIRQMPRALRQTAARSLCGRRQTESEQIYARFFLHQYLADRRRSASVRSTSQTYRIGCLYHQQPQRL